MVLQLITLVGGKDSNSYVSLEEADLFFSKRLNSQKWDLALESEKQKALIMATEIIDSLPFSGKKVSEDKQGSDKFQRLEWPRIPSYSDPYMLGIAHLRTETTASRKWSDSEGNYIIPEDLKNAICEEALFLLSAIKGIDKRDFLRGQGMNSISYPNVNEVFSNKKPLAPKAMMYLNKLNCFNNGLKVERG